MRRVSLLLAFVVLLTACGKEPKAPAGRNPGKVICGIGPVPFKVRVAAAASLRDLVSEHPSWITQTASFEASSVLSRQIESGANYDVFLSADAASVDRLGDKVDLNSRRVFLTNRLALILPAGERNVDLSNIPPGTRIAIAGPEVPAGKAWRSYLQAAGRLSELEHRFVIVENVRVALALFESEGVDAALVYSTDAVSAKRGNNVWIPPDGPEVAYVAVAVKKGAWNASEYLAWLASAEFLKRAKELGFLEPASK